MRVGWFVSIWFPPLQAHAHTHAPAHTCIRARALEWSIKLSRVCFDRILLRAVNSGFISEGNRQTKFSCNTMVPVCRQHSAAASRSDPLQTHTTVRHTHTMSGAKSQHQMIYFFITLCLKAVVVLRLVLLPLCHNRRHIKLPASSKDISTSIKARKNKQKTLPIFSHSLRKHCWS